jgi:hypothetical protein
LEGAGCRGAGRTKVLNMIGREATINLSLTKGIPAEIGDDMPIDKRFTHILSEPGASKSCAPQDVDPEMVAIKLSTNLDLFAVLLQYRINFSTGADHEITYGNKQFGYPGRREITLEGLGRLYRVPGGQGYLDLYLYPGMVPCIMQSIAWSDPFRNEMGFVGSVNIDKELGYA